MDSESRSQRQSSYNHQLGLIINKFDKFTILKYLRDFFVICISLHPWCSIWALSAQRRDGGPAQIFLDSQPGPPGVQGNRRRQRPRHLLKVRAVWWIFFLNIFTVDDLQEPQDPKMKNLDEIGACLDHHSRANPEMRQVVAGGRTKGRSAAAPCALPGNMSPLGKSLKVVNSQVENDQCMMMMMMMDANCLIGDSLEGTENVDRIWWRSTGQWKWWVVLPFLANRESLHVAENFQIPLFCLVA